MTRTQIVLRVAASTVVILSVLPAVRGTESPAVDANGKTLGEAFTPDVGAPISVPFQTTENLTLGAVTESSSDAAAADTLAKQLNNPVAALVSVPLQASEDAYSKDK